MTENKNYKLISQKEVTEIRSIAYQYEHVKTGARLLFLKNDDTNKAFSITFRTPPEDSTGCPHILEHSVLNGSRNFPAKNTFTELMKGSMKTFLNAFTASDHTSYPIASTNDQDFFNLMHVYLDAVLYPNIYNGPEVLKQEGWHHELFKPEDEIVYRGVVYNEMKGAFSSPELILYRKNQQVQFPDTPYGFESGGDPECIPQLSWEKFKAFHTKYYHPSNSWIYLYGDIDQEKVLAFLDEHYLSAFEKADPKSDIPIQKAFSQPVRIEESYSIGTDEDPAGRNYLALNFTCGNALDVMTTNAMAVMQEALMDSAASPLKLALQKSGLCADSFAYYDENCLQPTFSIICKHVRTEDLETLEKLIMSELERISREGFEKKLIEATINIKEFVWREAERGNFPKGLFYHSTVLKSWLHGGDPLAYLEFEPVLEHLRKGLTEPMYEQLISSFVLGNKHSSSIVLKPVQGLVEQKDERTRQILAEYKAKLSAEQISELVKDNVSLQEWQDTPDTPEDIAKIPFISVKDIKKEVEKLPLEEVSKDGYTLLKHDVFTNGIVYTSAYFDLSHMPEDDFQWLELASALLGSLDTENYSFAELSNEIDINTGGISASLVLYPNNRDNAKAIPRFVLRAKAVKAKVGRMLELAYEYACRTTFRDRERIHQLLKETKSRVQMMLISYGHQTAIRRMLAQTGQYHYWQDLTEGMEYYSFLNALDKKMESAPEDVLDKLAATIKSACHLNNLVLNITSPAADIEAMGQQFEQFVNGFPKLEACAADRSFTPRKLNEGIFAPVNIQFCAQGGNFKQLGYKYNGSLQVLTNILRNDFLMQELRVKGGAYGIMVLFARYGYAYFCSYRDPNLAETYAVYEKIAAYLENFKCSERDFEKYIIGTMAEFDMPTTPFQKGYNAAFNYIVGISEADRQQLRDEVLAATQDDIRKAAALVKAVIGLNQKTAFGVEAKLKQQSGMFDTLIPAIPV